VEPVSTVRFGSASPCTYTSRGATRFGNVTLRAGLREQQNAIIERMIKHGFTIAMHQRQSDDDEPRGLH
jgi:hypothetical protein